MDATQHSLGLGATIRDLQKKAGLTQGQLAEKVGLSRTSVTNIELGNQILTEPTLIALAEALGCELVVTFTSKDQGRLARWIPL